jgi:hypothetical protein
LQCLVRIPISVMTLSTMSAFTVTGYHFYMLKSLRRGSAIKV